MEQLNGSPALLGALRAMTNEWDPAAQEEVQQLTDKAACARPTLDVARTEAQVMVAWVLYEVSMMLHGLDLTEDVGLVRNVLDATRTDQASFERCIPVLMAAHGSVRARSVEKLFMGASLGGVEQVESKKLRDTDESIRLVVLGVEDLLRAWDNPDAYQTVGRMFAQILKRRNLPWIRRKGYITQLLEKRYER